MAASTTKRRLWVLNKKCFWCGKDTIWHEANTGTIPRNACTLDHVYRTQDPRRTLVPGAFVLACSSCNYTRALEQDGKKKISDLFPPNTEVALIDLLEQKEVDMSTEQSEEKVVDIVLLWGLFEYHRTSK
jgi:hypothetical protein